MTVASVTDLDPARQRKQRRAEVKAARTEARLTEALGNAKTPGQIAAVAFDHLRIAIAKLNKTDPNAATSLAWEVYEDLKSRADQINARR